MPFYKDIYNNLFTIVQSFYVQLNLILNVLESWAQKFENSNNFCWYEERKNIEYIYNVQFTHDD